MSLWSYFLNNDKRSIFKWTHYFPMYERHLQKFRNQSVTIFEIGCGKGGSLQMWKDFFGPYARIVGIDIRPECKEFEEAQIDVRIGWQEDTAFLKDLVLEFGPPTVVIDDGSHIMQHLEITFRFLYPMLPINGVYVAEDLHTCYWDEFGGGLRKPGSFIEIAKHLVDELHAGYTRGELEETAFSRETMSMHFYDSAIVFERGRHVVKHAPKIGRVD